MAEFWEDYFNQAFRTYSGGVPTHKNDPVYKQCIEDAKEYFAGKYYLEEESIRRSLPAEAKERIVEFLKSRLKYYGENGLVI